MDWVVDPPQSILTPEFAQSLSKSAQITVFLSTFFSYSLAKSILTASLSTSLGPTEVPTPAVVFSMNFGLLLISFISMTFLMSRVARWVTGETGSFRYWITTGVIAMIPLHLTLPLALICRPLGDAGQIIFALGALTFWGMTIRRWAWGVQSRYHWPFWAALLIVISPFLIGSFFLLISAAFLVVAVCLVLLGLLT